MRDIKFLYKMDISHRAFVVYAYLADRADENGECWPAVKRIASDTKMSEATVRIAVRELRKEKLIKTEQRYRYYGEKSSLLYKLL
ncbi:MAG: helix-turn-helix domain-containing protein [Ruminococcus sp.]|nr:helix-turn-helix domain-containing protein [Ruminococcus sp.]